MFPALDLNANRLVSAEQLWPKQSQTGYPEPLGHESTLDRPTSPSRASPVLDSGSELTEIPGNLLQSQVVNRRPDVAIRSMNTGWMVLIRMHAALQLLDI